MPTARSHTSQARVARPSRIAQLLSSALTLATLSLSPSRALSTPSLSLTRALSPSVNAELGGVWGPERSDEERARLPWRPREGGGLYPARLEVALRGAQGAWSYQLGGRLFSSLVLADNEQAVALSDPLGRAPQLNSAWVARTFGGSHNTLTLKVGRWVPKLTPHPLSWSLEAREGLMSRAQDPRDRAVSGAELSWAPTSAHFISLRAFTPSDTHALIARERLGLGGALSVLWRGDQAQEGARLDTLAVELGAHSHEELRWARAALSATGARSEGGAHLQLAVRALYRSRSASSDALEEARLAAFGLDGVGLSVSHELSYHFGASPSSARLAVGYEWRDPQLSFQHNAQHALPLSASLPLAQDHLALRLEYRHLWSDKDNRGSFSSDVALLLLRYRLGDA